MRSIMPVLSAFSLALMQLSYAADSVTVTSGLTPTATFKSVDYPFKLAEGVLSSPTQSNVYSGTALYSSDILSGTTNFRLIIAGVICPAVSDRSTFSSNVYGTYDHKPYVKLTIEKQDRSTNTDMTNPANNYITRSYSICPASLVDYSASSVYHLSYWVNRKANPVSYFKVASSYPSSYNLVSDTSYTINTNFASYFTNAGYAGLTSYSPSAAACMVWVADNWPDAGFNCQTGTPFYNFLYAQPGYITQQFAINSLTNTKQGISASYVDPTPQDRPQDVKNIRWELWCYPPGWTPPALDPNGDCANGV